MPDCFSKSEVTDFLNFMKLPDGTSVVSDDMMEYLMAYGFLPPLLLLSTTAITRAVFWNTPTWSRSSS